MEPTVEQIPKLKHAGAIDADGYILECKWDFYSGPPLWNFTIFRLADLGPLVPGRASSISQLAGNR